MSILVTLILNLLVSFITMLIKRWLDKHIVPTASEMISAKGEFLKSVKWRVWLGPSRMEKASKAYDMAVLRFADMPKGGIAAGEEANIAQWLCVGIGDKL